MENERDLPVGWMSIDLGDVCKVKNGYAFKSSFYNTNGVPVIRISDINDGVVSTDNAVKTIESGKFDNYVINYEDILIAMTGSIGKCGIFKSHHKAYQNQRVGKFQVINPNVLEAKYLFYHILSMKRDIELHAYGGVQANISAKGVESLPFCIAPLPEQYRIVEKIEEFFSEIDKGVESLEKAKAQLEMYRKTALNQTFNRDRRTTLEKTIKELSTIVTSGSRGWAKYYSEEGEKFIRIGNMSRKTILLDLSNAQRVKLPESAEGKRSKLAEGDLLISITADLGSVSVVPDNIGDAYINQHIAMVRLVNPSSAKYLAYFLKSSEGNSRLLRYQRGATKIGLGLDDIRSIRVPIPSIEEQHKIVQEIESRLSVCDKVEESIEQGLKQAEMLKQSVLKKAFEGKLVPQNPEDEPASVLLERIRQERESLEKVEKESAPKTKKKTAKGKKS